MRNLGHIRSSKMTEAQKQARWGLVGPCGRKRHAAHHAAPTHSPARRNGLHGMAKRMRVALAWRQGYDITLRTQSRDDRFPHASTFHEDLCARIEDRFSGKFRVGKCGRPSWFAKQYWVAAHDEKEGFKVAPRSRVPLYVMRVAS